VKDLLPPTTRKLAAGPCRRAAGQRQGRRDTVPELAVRRRLHARGVRYRVDVRPCRETRARGDLVWKGRRLVVFLDG
jgi:DNA mismatch endonuclease, patch repair protein